MSSPTDAQWQGFSKILDNFSKRIDAGTYHVRMFLCVFPSVLLVKTIFQDMMRIIFIVIIIIIIVTMMMMPTKGYKRKNDGWMWIVC